MSKDNSKRSNFVRLAEGRTQSALQAIRKLGNLSNKRAYDYTNEDIKIITRALRDAISELEHSFNSKDSSTNTFKLK
uniref:Uncharacterized protein n=1 Tax=OCS116 cluster bacterium TaxID=2030921 RepID=A0A2A4Z9L9_9PROT